MQAAAADDARESRLQKLVSSPENTKGAGPANAGESTEDPTSGTARADEGNFSSSAPAPEPQPSGGRLSPTQSQTTVCLMPHVGVQVIPPINFGMVEDGLYRWSEHIAQLTSRSTARRGVPTSLVLLSVWNSSDAFWFAFGICHDTVGRLRSSTFRS